MVVPGPRVGLVLKWGLNAMYNDCLCPHLGVIQGVYTVHNMWFLWGVTSKESEPFCKAEFQTWLCSRDETCIADAGRHN